MFFSLTSYYVKLGFILFGIQITISHVSSFEQHSEVKTVRKPVQLLNFNNQNVNTHSGNLNKRQINPGLTQFGSSVESQFFQQPFGSIPSSSFSQDDGQGGISQFPNSQFLDEEDRFFLSGERTTLNPLSFLNPPSTQNPIQQQLAEEQRRFQQEQADKGLREQQQLSLGLPRPRTTTPPPITNFDFSNFNQQNPLLQSEFADPGSFSNEFPSNTQDPYFSSLRNFRSVSQNRAKLPRRFLRSVDQQVGSNEFSNYFSPTASPRPYLNNLLQPSAAKGDSTQFSNWLIDALTKQLQRNLARLTEGNTKLYQPATLKPAPEFGSPVKSSFPDLRSIRYTTEAPVQPISFSTPGTVDVTHLPNWNSNTDINQIPNWGGFQSDSIDVTPTPNWNDVKSLNTPTTANIIEDYVEPKKVKNLQIIPYSTELPNIPVTIRQSDFNNFPVYKQIYDTDQQTVKPISTTFFPYETTSAFPVTSTEPYPYQSTVSVTSLFRKKLTELKDPDNSNQNSINLLQDGYSDFEQHNRFLDQLLRQNSTGNGTSNVEGVTSVYDGNLGTAIFVKVPDDNPTSTVGYLFDKTLTKSLHKKENGSPKNKISNRSPQTVKSTLVYRTPPGKRATASVTEITRNSQIENNLFTNLLLGDSPKPLKWFFGGNQHSTTSRPLVSALLNLIQK